MSNIYELALHQTAVIGKFEVLRVPNGWVYWNQSLTAGVFVPFNTELKDIAKTIGKVRIIKSTEHKEE